MKSKTFKKKGRLVEASTEIIYGVHSVREAVLSGKRRIHDVFVAQGAGKRIVGLVELFETKGIPFKTVSLEFLFNKTGSEHHQGVAAKTDPFPLTSESGMIKEAESFILLLDGVQDPQNLGALLRTALSAGVDGVILPKDRACMPTPSVSRISAGAMEHLRVSAVVNMNRTLSKLKEKGFWVYGTDREEGGNLYTADITFPVALVIGNEEKGIRPLVKKNCDVLLSIPQKGPLDSLNASVAGAVCMYECFRRQMISGAQNS